MIPEEFGNLRLIDLTLSNSENRLAIEFEEDEGGFQTNSFVTVNEGMVLDKMKQAGCRHRS
jgi:hypothetical protein